MSQITYADKVTLDAQPSVARINKVIDTDMNEIKNVVNANYIELGGNILWTNSSPTSDFTSQSITLNSNDYDMFEVIYATNKTGEIYGNTGKIPKGKGVRIKNIAGISGTGIYGYYRTFSYVSDTSLSITDCQVVYGTTLTTNNEQLIPIYVVGYKTGLFNV